jgi:hypothetical protein
MSPATNLHPIENPFLGVKERKNERQKESKIDRKKERKKEKSET